MDLGFTKSKAYSNLRFKVEGRRPVMILLYVDDLFLTGKQELIKVARRRLAVEFEMKDLVMGITFQAWRCGRIQMESPWTSELCSGYPEEVQDDGLQGHDKTYVIKPKAIE